MDQLQGFYDEEKKDKVHTTKHKRREMLDRACFYSNSHQIMLFDFTVIETVSSVTVGKMTLTE